MRKFIDMRGLLGLLSLSLIFLLAQKAPTGIAKSYQLDEQSATIQAINKVTPAVVSISVSERRPLRKVDPVAGLSTSTPKEIFQGSGTGFLISSDGLIITNRHVVDASTGPHTAYRITLSSGKRYYAQLIGRDPLNDLALLKIFDKNLPYVELGDSDKLPVGSSVIAIGNVLGIYQNSVTKGIISGLNRDIVAADALGNPESLGNVLQTDAQINPGNSGGPLVDLQGRVVGVNVAIDATAQAINFAIPINDVKPVISSARTIGRIFRPRLGIRYLTLDTDLAEKHGLTVSQGAWVYSTDEAPAVVPGSPADRAGLKVGDVVLEINGIRLDTKRTLIGVIQQLKPGQSINLMVRRQNQNLKLTALLDEFPIP